MNPPIAANAPLLPDLQAMLEMDTVGPDCYLGRHNLANSRRGLYGGQILSQALTAAARTTDGARAPSELKILFLLAGNPEHKVRYEVETLLEGGSFSIRRVRCTQEQRLIADVTASFHRGKEGYAHQLAMPTGLPAPETLQSAPQLAQLIRDRLAQGTFDLMSRSMPVELRPVDPEDFLNRPAQRSEFRYWAKATTPLPDRADAHYPALAFMSDWWFNASSYMAHLPHIDGRSSSVVSLNHTVWFHREPRCDDWLYFHSTSPAASHSRGLSVGYVWNRAGQLLASMAQECLGRPVRHQP